MSTSARAKDGDIVSEFTIGVDQVDDFEFRVRFDKPNHVDLVMDEPAPLGKDAGPTATRVLAAAIGNCLSASLLFCARKSRVGIGPIHTRVTTRISRNENGRLRISGIDVKVDPGVRDPEEQKSLRCLEL